MNESPPEGPIEENSLKIATEYVRKNREKLGQALPVWMEILHIAKTKKVDWKKKASELKFDKFGTDLFTNTMNQKKRKQHETVIFVNK